MKNRINKNFIMLCGFSVILTVLSLLLVFYTVFNEQMQTQVKGQAELLKNTFNLSSDKLELANKLKNENGKTRITLIKPDGAVVYDSHHEVSSLDNHMERPEIQLAIKEGYGEGTRLSQSLGKETYYCAIRLNDGYILRISQTTESILGIFSHLMLPIWIIAAAVFLVCNIISDRLTMRIIDPLNQINLDSEELYNCYEELAPFVRKIRNQKVKIEAQMDLISERADTIEAIIQNMREGIILLDKGHAVCSINNEAKKIFKVNDSVIGNDFFFISRKVELLNSLTMALKGKKSSVTAEFDGKIYNLFFSPVEGGGSIILCLDITERELNESIRREFTANVSHELKTPLTTIIGSAELIENGMVKPQDERDFIVKIKNEAQRLLRLIEDIIRLSQLDENAISEEKTDVDLSQIAEAVIESLSVNASKSHVVLNSKLRETHIFGNERMLFEIIYNLIDNGIKYNVENGSVTLSVSTQDGHAVISVSDSGIGIGTKELERIFERFYRVDKSRSKKTGGTGLGLSIVKHGVMYHGGNISVDSTLGAGTTITITF